MSNKKKQFLLISKITAVLLIAEFLVGFGFGKLFNPSTNPLSWIVFPMALTFLGWLVVSFEILFQKEKYFGIDSLKPISNPLAVFAMGKSEARKTYLSNFKSWNINLGEMKKDKCTKTLIGPDFIHELVKAGNIKHLVDQGYFSELIEAGYTKALVKGGYFKKIAMQEHIRPLVEAGYFNKLVNDKEYSIRYIGSLVRAGYIKELMSAKYFKKFSYATDWNEIPVLEKPYTRLMNDLKDKKRRISQDISVPLGYSNEIDISQTPMSTGGHLINLAGQIGVQIMDRYGWKVAGALIAEKAHPGWPQQNYDKIPDEWALAFISEMAEWEKG